MVSTVRRLEQMLQVWEDTFFIFWASAKALVGLGQPAPVPLAGPVVHAPEFRKHLLDREASEFDTQRFIGPPELYRLIQGTAGSSLTVLPQFLKGWTQHSRRVFHVSPDLQVLLGHTTLKGVQWSDVHWPFDSFVVSLETPIIDAGGHAYDCVLFSKIEDFVSKEKMLGFLLFSSEFETVKIISKFDKSQLGEWLRKGKYLQVASRIRHVANTGHQAHASCFFVRAEGNSWSVSETSEKNTIGYDEEDQLINGKDYPHPEWGITARLVVGLVLYLATLPSGSPHYTPWVKVRSGKPDPRSITSEADIFSVSTNFVLTAEENELVREFKKKGNYELCAHFRIGHWRRPPGKGSDPTAAKTVWVRPTLVRADRLGPNEVPGGATSVLQ